MAARPPGPGRERQEAGHRSRVQGWQSGPGRERQEAGHRSRVQGWQRHLGLASETPGRLTLSIWATGTVFPPQGGGEG